LDGNTHCVFIRAGKYDRLIGLSECLSLASFIEISERGDWRFGKITIVKKIDHPNSNPSRTILQRTRKCRKRSWLLNSGKTQMVNLTIKRLVSHGFMLSGLILLAVQSGCSLPGAKPVASYPGPPYQSNYPPAYSPTNAVQSTPGYGLWNRSGLNGPAQSNQLQSFNSQGFAGQTC
jgi:hypothetical protein